MGVGILALLPLLAFFLQSRKQLHDVTMDGWQREMAHLAEMAATVQHDALAGYRTVLSVLAELPEAQLTDPALCASLLGRLVELRSGYTVLGAIEPDGYIRCSAPANDRPSYYGDRPYFQEALATGRSSTSEYHLGRASGRPSIVVAEPVIGESGEVHTVLAAGISLTLLTARMSEGTLPAGTTLTLFDQEGTVLVRLPGDEALLGSVFPSDIVSAAREASHHSSTYEGEDLDGSTRIFSFAAIELGGDSPHGYVAVGFDPKFAASLFYDVLRTNVIGMVIAALALLFGIWIFLEFVVLRRLTKVVDTAERIGSGDLSARTGLTYGRDELSHLARTFDEMAESVEQLREAEAKRSKGEIRELDERFQQIAATISEVFWLYDPKGEKVLYVSPAYRTIWGKSPEFVLDHPEEWEKDVHPEDRDRRLGARMDEEKEHEYRIIHPDGGIRWIRERTFPVRSEDGRTIRIAGVSEDVTEKRELEEELRQSQKMEAVGKLAGGVAHDFNNILTAIQGHTQLLLAEMEDTASPTRADLEEIGRAADRAASLVRQLLAFSRTQILQPREIVLGSVIQSMERMLRRTIGSHIELIMIPDRDAGVIRADETQIEQIILNLALNARDAMPEGGVLSIRTENWQVSAADLRERAKGLLPGPYVLLSIRDTGEGIADGILEHIFEPFFTTKAMGQGTGLGLASVHGIVEQSGGHIRVSSALGKGTTFDLYFPRVSGGVLSEGVEEPLPPEPIDGATAVVLLAEDEPGVRSVARRILESHGFRVLEAEHGGEALEIARARGGRIDLLLTDIIMPVMRGPELAKRLKLERPEMKVLFMSGYAETTGDGTAVARKDGLFLMKPFSPATLLRHVQQALEDPIASAEALQS